METHQPRPLTHSRTCFRVRLPLQALSPWESPRVRSQKAGGGFCTNNCAAIIQTSQPVALAPLTLSFPQEGLFSPVPRPRGKSE